MVNKDFFSALNDLEQLKGIKKEVFIGALETALINAYKKHSGIQKAVDVRLNPDSNKINIFAYQTVVEVVEDKEKEISLEDARLVSKKYRVGDIVKEEVFSKDFGRIAAQTAKQIIMQKLREVESDMAFSALTQKEDELITCNVRRIEGKTVFVEIDKLEAQLNPADLMPNDRFRVGERIKVYVKKIKQGQRGPQIIVSRSVAGYVKKLFELEVPEIANGLVTIKSIAREAGYRTKIAVHADDKEIDPVGACVGNRGMRVNSIVSQLGGEKIDIIPWCSDNLEFIARALSPAKVVMVQVNDDDKTAKVVVLDDMLSLAIGKEGQNARLAARLTGWKIDVKPYSAVTLSQKQELENAEANASAKAADEKPADVFDEELGELE